jgi:RND family efflux transporter MFP subunit
MNIRTSWLCACIATVACGSADAKPPSPAAAPVVAPQSVPAVDPTVAEAPGHVGVLLPAAAIDLAPGYDGELEAVSVRVGDWVAAGAQVARFDPSAATEALAMARAEVKVAQGEAAQASAMARHAGKRLATERVLVEQGISAAVAIDDAQADRARHGAASSSAAGRIAGAKARVEQLERQLQQMTLVAPFAGQVSIIHREAGAIAGPSKPVLRLVDTSRSFVRFAVPPEDALQFPKGQSVEVVVEGSATPLPATVRDVSPEVDAPSGKVFVEAEIAAAAVGQARPHSAAWVRVASSRSVTQTVGR